MNQTILSQRFSDALVYACELHRHQRRKVSGVPYVSHLLSVTAFVLEDGGTEDEAIAALLHDAVEDQGGVAVKAAIRERFGEAVVEIVAGCTEWDTPPKPPWKVRKLRYLDQLRRASRSVLRVSLADKLHNARSLWLDQQQVGDRVWESFSQGREEMLWFYRELLTIYLTTGSGLAIEFAEMIEKLAKVAVGRPMAPRD